MSEHENDRKQQITYGIKEEKAQIWPGTWEFIKICQGGRNLTHKKVPGGDISSSN